MQANLSSRISESVGIVAIVSLHAHVRQMLGPSISQCNTNSLANSNLKSNADATTCECTGKVGICYECPSQQAALVVSTTGSLAADIANPIANALSNSLDYGAQVTEVFDCSQIA